MLPFDLIFESYNCTKFDFGSLLQTLLGELTALS